MSNQRLNKQRLAATIVACSLGGVANAALTIQSSSEPSARISWGGADSLSEARTIMYGKQSITKIKKVDNGYDSSANQHYRTTYHNTHIDNEPYNSSYSNNNRSSYYNPSYNSSSVFESLPISAKSRGVLVLDLETGLPLYEKNADVARPIASISKIMAAMVVLDSGQDMREEIKLEPFDFTGPKKASSRLSSGDRLNRAELLLMMLMKSENPAAKSLARAYPGGYNAFMRAMNQKAQSLGMSSAFFGDPTGLDKRNVASPNDLAKMIKAAGNYDVIRRFSTTKNYDFFVANYSQGNRLYPAKNTSVLVRSGNYPIGISKTGYIRESGRCVVMETHVNNRPAIVVILGANSSETRWNDAKSIIASLAMRRTV